MAQVRLILREDVPNLGDAGDLVSVKPGYARNFLLPKGKATVATESRVKELEHHRRVIEEKLGKQLKDARAVEGRLSGIKLETTEKAGTEGKLFGSVTNMRIAELLAEKGFEVDRRKVKLAEPIKTVGEHTVSVKLHRDLETTVKITVHADVVVQEEPDVQDTFSEEALRDDRDRRRRDDDDDDEGPPLDEDAGSRDAE